ncbi:MAG: holo-ACP synthase [Verrucomicrobia bacterium]|nr:holo-ACP synthase [Verrucomicrobiota bacterium]
MLGTGIDIVENDRIESMIKRWSEHFLDRVFLPAEQAYCLEKARPSLHLAGRFAVKEAVSKAFRTGIGPRFGWLDLEVERNAESGAPSIKFHGKAAEFAEELGVSRMMISLAHTRHYAVANAVLLGESSSGVDS